MALRDNTSFVLLKRLDNNSCYVYQHAIGKVVIVDWKSPIISKEMS